jgi:uncharacterized protein YndB with AHSA1/START domain
MREPGLRPTIDGAPAAGDDRERRAAWPRLRGPEQLGETLPALHLPPPQPVVRDRWERLVTTIEVPHGPEEVWQALTAPEALARWLAVCRGGLAEVDRDVVLDFEDGEFFLCRPTWVRRPQRLEWVWRWLGIGQATWVGWHLEPVDGRTRVTVTEEATNPPWDWQTWNGGGWPGILEQLAAFLRTGTEWRWPWRRMGPYAQIELPVPMYQAWDRLVGSPALRYWLQPMHGTLAPGQPLTILMGDASGIVEMHVQEVVHPGERPPSFLPSITYALRRPVWGCEVGGRLWIEPAGWGRSLLQVFHFNWENLPPGLQLPERRILTGFWAGAVRRAALVCGPTEVPAAPHGW